MDKHCKPVFPPIIPINVLYVTDNETAAGF